MAGLARSRKAIALYSCLRASPAQSRFPTTAPIAYPQHRPFARRRTALWQSGYDDDSPVAPAKYARTEWRGLPEGHTRRLDRGPQRQDICGWAAKITEN